MCLYVVVPGRPMPPSLGRVTHHSIELECDSVSVCCSSGAPHAPSLGRVTHHSIELECDSVSVCCSSGAPHASVIGQGDTPQYRARV